MRLLAYAMALAIVFFVLLVGISVASTMAAIVLPGLFNGHPDVVPGHLTVHSAPHFGTHYEPMVRVSGPMPWAGYAQIGMLGTALLLSFAFALVLFVLGRRSRRHEPRRTDDDRMMQELYRRSSDMERRLESLETLLLERVAAAPKRNHRD